MFERPVFKDYKLQSYKWFLEPEYVPRKTTAGIRYIDHENVAEFVLTQQRDLSLRCESLGKWIIMDGFSFQNKFCQHFEYLRENAKVFVSFNIDRCQSILNDKITMSL